MDILFTKKVPKDILSLHEDKPYHKKCRNVNYLFISGSILQILVILVYPYINKGLYELSPSHSGLGPI